MCSLLDLTIDWINAIKLLWNQQPKRNKSVIFIGLTVCSCIGLRESYWSLYRKYHSLPPGPNGWPLIGILPQWSKGTTSRINLSKKYGPIFYSPFVGGPRITISSSKLIKELLHQKEFLNRFVMADPKRDYHHSMNTVGESGANAFINTNGPSWVKRRKASSDTLFRVLNNTTTANILNDVMKTELKPYLDEIMETNKGWNPKEIFEFITFNTIYSTLVGKKLSRNSDLYRVMNQDIANTFQYALLDVMVMKLPGFKWLYGEKLDIIRERRNNTYLRLINERINDNDSNTDSKERSYVDYIHEMVKNGDISQDEEIADMALLFVAGMETTSSTLDFAVALLAKNQDVQDKVRAELIDIMGQEFNLKMVNKCVLFKAAIHEIMRISSVVFNGLNRTTFKDHWITMDDGTRYKIPKNTQIRPDVEFVHIYGQDEHWKRVNGDEIILENFLTKDEDGENRFVVNESFIPFGVGKRDCIRRGLAMKETYYTLGYLLMNYKVSFKNKQAENVDISLHKKANIVTVFLAPPLPIHLDSVSK